MNEKQETSKSSSILSAINMTPLNKKEPNKVRQEYTDDVLMEAEKMLKSNQKTINVNSVNILQTDFSNIEQESNIYKTDNSNQQLILNNKPIDPIVKNPID